ncbi:glycoside hydrolase family 32 protein [Arthrobacter sp. ISL-72]|uniref:glycoside hydrolase family 32 protein n=1 Tax=Arthrobacter sp. ISL-72 TaxID=2819114 RepID=UPI001BE91F92|nr:glycoside hydrolase family 32 protein [Arthrobacter sp. ISL-72]MBT2596177.1 glycoside hydrolase family 32 protein [Arthrobacter sp. ISL-72]
MNKQDLRPALHFTAAEGWINDPLGVTWKDGQYHLFYQYVPGRTTWASNCHWGHATSPDMIAWTEQGVAVAPGEGDDGVWSGSIVTGTDGAATMFYTSVTEPDIGIGTIRTATPEDASWDTWTKGGKLMTAPDLGVVAYRDPFVFRDGEQWRMFVGAGLEGGTAAAVSYSSPDLAEWTLDGIAAQRNGSETDRVWTGTMWECPQLFEIGGSHVLVTSIWEDDVLHYVAYGVGSYSGGEFTARSWGQLSFGKSYYAPSFFRDKDGAPSLIFWVRGVLDPDGKWASALSIPHTLTLDGDVLVATPHADLAKYSQPGQLEQVGAAVFETVLDGGADLRCTVTAGTVIRLSGPEGSLAGTPAGTLAGTLAAVRHDGEGIRVTVNGNADFTDAFLPAEEGSELRVIIDAGVLELSGRQGIMAVPLPVVDSPVTLTVTGTASEPLLSTVTKPAAKAEDLYLAATPAVS